MTSFSTAWRAAAALAIVLGVAACKPPERAGKPKSGNMGGRFGMPSGEIKQDKPFLTPVLAEHARRGEIYASISTTCSVVPIRSRLLRVEEAGRLHFVKDWREGEPVKKGDIIARIDSETLKGDIARAQADVALQEEQLAIGKKSMDAAVREYQILQDLYSRGIAALRDVENSQLSMQRAINTHRQDQINLEKAKASYQTVLDRRERIEIRAPFDGLIVARTTLDGTKPFATTFGTETITDFDQRLVANEFAVCGVIDTSQVLLRSDVTSKDIGKVRLDQEAIATMYATTDFTATGKVVTISKNVSQDTRAFQVDVLVDNTDLALKPGMFGRVDVVTERRRDVIAIPKELITRRNNRDVIFLAQKSPGVDYHVAHETPVELGLEGKDSIEVSFGINSGDAIITRGFEVLQDKTPIQVVFSDEAVTPAAKPAAENTDQAATGEQPKQAAAK